MAFTEKQKTFFKKNYFEAGISKEEVKYIRSTNKDFSQKYPTLRAAWLANKNYIQISTGRNHEERGVVVVDDDTRNIEEALRNFRLLKFPMPNIIIENPDTHHTQSFYFLKEPVMIKSYSTIREKSIEKNTSNYKKYKEVNDMMNFLAGDPNFTCWRCKNPFNDKFETIECRLEEYTLNELYNEVKDTYEITKLLNKKEDNKKSKSSDKYFTFNKRYSSEHETNKDYNSVIIDGIECRYKDITRTPSRTMTMLQICQSVLYDHRDWTESQMLEFAKKHNYEICRLVNKSSLSDNEIEEIVNGAYSYFLSKKSNCIYSKEQSINSAKIRNIKKLIRINKIRKDLYSDKYFTFNKRYVSINELAEKYDVTRMQINRDKKLLENKEELLKMAEEAKKFIDNNRGCYNTNENVKYIKKEANEIEELIHVLKEELIKVNNNSDKYFTFNKRYVF